MTALRQRQWQVLAGTASWAHHPGVLQYMAKRSMVVGSVACGCVWVCEARGCLVISLSWRFRLCVADIPCSYPLDRPSVIQLCSPTTHTVHDEGMQPSKAVSADELCCAHLSVGASWQAGLGAFACLASKHDPILWHASATIFSGNSTERVLCMLVQVPSAATCLRCL